MYGRKFLAVTEITYYKKSKNNNMCFTEKNEILYTCNRSTVFSFHLSHYQQKSHWSHNTYYLLPQHL